MNRLKQYYEKYNLLPLTLKASMWFTFCSLLQRGMSFLTVPIFTRLMTTQEYGVVTLYQSWLGVFYVICTLNITYGGFYNGMVKYKDDRDGYTSSILGLTSVLTIVWAVIYSLFKRQLLPILGMPDIIIYLMFAEILGKSVYDTWITRQRYDFNYKIQTLVTVLCAIITPVLGIILVQNMNDKALARILSFVVVFLIVGGWLYVGILKKSTTIFNRKYWTFSVGFCIPLIPHFLAQTVLSQSDRIMINSMVGTSEAAIYGFSYNIAMVLTIVYQAINNSFIPWLYQKMEGKEYTDINKITQTLLLMIAVVSGIVMLFAPEAVMILGGEKYAEAIAIIPPVIASVFFMFLFSVFCNVEVYFEKNYYATIASVVAAVLNVILNYIFIPIAGYVAAGYTTVFCYMILSVTHYICMKKICRDKKIERTIFDVRPVVVMSIGVSLFGIFARVLYVNNVLRYVFCVVALSLCCVKRKRITEIMKLLKTRG